MTRLRADLLLGLAAIIWGTAFIAQKTGMDGLGPFGFVGVRFVFSFLVVLPLALREKRKTAFRQKPGIFSMALLCGSFFGGVILQQAGLLTTTVTNAGFLTGLYVILVPFVAWVLFRRRPGWVVWLSSAMALLGVWLLNGASLSAFSAGDWMVMAGAVCYAVHITMIGWLVQKTGRPFSWVALQYGAVAVLGLAGMALFESISVHMVMDNIGPLLYTGIVSGGVAYTIQAVAQEHTPPSDAAVIMSGEALFAALAGALLLGERLSPLGWSGCALIMAAMLLVEIGPLMHKKQSVKGAN